MKLVHYFSNSRSLYLLSCTNEFKKKLLFIDLKKIPFKGYKIVIEINKLSDYFDDGSLKHYEKKSYNVYSNLIYSKKNKFNIRLEFANTNFLLKAYVPFWGKVTKNNMWLAFIEN